MEMWKLAMKTINKVHGSQLFDGVYYNSGLTDSGSGGNALRVQALFIIMIW